jgi:lipid-binding SYLF domain-containing protein
MKHRWLWVAPLAVSLFAAEPSGSVQLQNATAAFHEIMAAPDKGIPRDLLDKSQCIVIVPDLMKAAFIVGGKYGRGFASCRHGYGWSSPASVRIEGGSFGFQLGGSSTDLIMLIMNQRGMQRLLGDKFTIGGTAEAAAGPVGRATSAQTDLAMHAEILTWSRSRGLFGGISLEGATLRPDKSENRKLYGREISNREILESGVPTPPAGRRFVAMLDRDSHLSGGPGPVEALREPGGRMVFGEKQIRFATNQSAIPAEAEPALTRVAQTLKDNPTWRVRVEGFTDNVGSRAANAKLSQQRADAVKNWLVNNGVDQSRVRAKGFGESRPVASNASENGRADNRRVEIVRIGPAAPTGE